MPNHNLYVERRDDGDYSMRRKGAERPSDIASTQSKAIDRARQIDPNAAIHVERVRDTNVGGLDK
jgi:Uncharacterized protein conserved in bacteria (DUF2188)